MRMHDPFSRLANVWSIIRGRKFSMRKSDDCCCPLLQELHHRKKN